MDLELLYKGIMSGMVGAVLGLFLPDMVSGVIEYKCKQRRLRQPDSQSLLSGALFMGIIVFMVSASVVAGIVAPIGLDMFLIVFAAMSLIVSLTDYYIRLIPNECVLMIIIIGIIYRFCQGGGIALLNSLVALGVIVLIFGGSAAIFYMIKKQSGVGAGDIKLAMAIAITVGIPGVYYFLLGMALAVIVYLLAVIKLRRFSVNRYFPMAAHLCIGFLMALYGSYIIDSSVITMFGLG